ncbi:GntR family transcriptional regulator [Bifidobacterium jacchi]|uniref:GntR family transcriptional regulator n=1 Tax=Bifidobacterium jacchi TaxID=2490545 RepID=A0A5N5RPW7_9BIFI|nr:GntR family transcriptional regulator [Bifidobacterium jacchi]
MVIEIDQHSDVPIYEQLRRRIIAGIAHGELAPGARLPSVRALAVDLGVNLHTVNRAYALLRDDGYITMRRGSGASVAEPTGSGADAGRNVARHGQGTPNGEGEREGDDDGRVMPSEQIVGELHRLILEHKALGGDMASFLDAFRRQCERIYDETPQGDGRRPATADRRPPTGDRRPATADHQSGGTR